MTLWGQRYLTQSLDHRSADWIVSDDFSCGYYERAEKLVPCIHSIPRTLILPRISARPSGSESVKPEVDLTWAFSAARSTDANGLSVLDATIDGVNQLIASREYRFLDRVLDLIPTDKASRHVVLALARSSFPVRSKLTKWQKFVRNARTSFAVRGLDADRLLKGLL